MKKLFLFVVLFCTMVLKAMAQNDLSLEFSSYGDIVCGVSGEGEILVSKDEGATWTSLNFNEVYDGYYKPLTIKAVAAGDRTMAIAGTDSDGRPAVYFSSDGGVWTPRDLSYTVNGKTFYLERQPLALQYDSELDRMEMLCEGDAVFYMPNCSHCNSLSINP